MDVETGLQVRMLGGLTLCLGDRRIGDQDSRSWKVWLMLSYLIYNRERVVTMEELFQLLWREGSRSVDTKNALKTILHRARVVLNTLRPELGLELILRENGNYVWGRDMPLVLDVDEFVRQRQLAETAVDPADRQRACLKAVSIYGGDFLPEMVGEPWVLTIAGNLHEQYLQMVLEVLPTLREDGKQAEALELCRKAVAIDPHCEKLYQCWMEILVELGRQSEAATVYDALRERLYVDLGTMPSAYSQTLYRKAQQTCSDTLLSLDGLSRQMQEPAVPEGAMICDYDFFRNICQAKARSLLREGSVAHLCLLSVKGRREKELARRSLELCIQNLQDLIRTNLRCGDVVARCSLSQYVLLLPHASYENSCLVCDRLIRAFCRQYPHSPAVLHYGVIPVEANMQPVL